MYELEGKERGMVMVVGFSFIGLMSVDILDGVSVSVSFLDPYPAH